MTINRRTKPYTEIPPNRAQPVQFPERADYMAGYIPVFSDDLNVMADEFNATAENVNNLEQSAKNSKDLAEDAALVANSASNIKGVFIPGQTNALQNETWVYEGGFWFALTDTSATPQESIGDWVSLSEHNSLTNRDELDAHPASAIDGVSDMRNELIGGVIYPREPELLLSVGDQINNDVTHVRLDNGIYAISTVAEGIVSEIDNDKIVVNGVDVAIYKLKTPSKNAINILDYAETNDYSSVSDWLPIYTRVKSLLESLGGGELVWPYIGGYPISNTIWQPSNTSWYMYDEMIATTIMSPYECMISPDVGAENINTYNLRMNGDNLPAVSGLMPRRGCKNVKYFGVYGRNFAHDKTRKGGRVFSPQGGVDGGGNFDVQVFGLHAKDCYNYIDIAGDELNKNSRIVVCGGTVENCEVPFTNFNTSPNYNTYPLSQDALSGVVSNIVCKNVGVSTTYVRNGAIFNSQGGGNVSYDNIRIFNDSDYTAAKKPNIVMGKFSNQRITNVVYEGECSFILDGRLWDESDESSTENVMDILDSTIDVEIVGSCLGTVSLQAKQGGGFNADRLNVKARVKHLDSANPILPLSYSVKPDCYLDLTETATGKGIGGTFEQVAISGASMDNLAGYLKMAGGLYVHSDEATKQGLGHVTVNNFAPAVKTFDRSAGGVGWGFYNDNGLWTLAYDANKTDSWQDIWQWNSSRMRPAVDNQQDIGDPSFRVKMLYLANSPSVTSDDRYKQYNNIEDSEIRVAEKLKVRKFKYNEAIEAKGELARVHFGYSAQEVISAFESEGLDAFDYALVRKVPLVNKDPSELEEDEFRYEVLLEQINAFILMTK